MGQIGWVLDDLPEKMGGLKIKHMFQTLRRQEDNSDTGDESVALNPA